MRREVAFRVSRGRLTTEKIEAAIVRSMKNKTTKDLFDLVKGMSRSEKRVFIQFIKRNCNTVELQVLKVFRVLDRMAEYNERAFHRSIKGIQYHEVTRVKVQLYNQILECLRIYKRRGSLLLQLHQMMDHANILLQGGYFILADKVLNRLRNRASEFHQLTFLFYALTMKHKLKFVNDNAFSLPPDDLSKELCSCSRQLSLLGYISDLTMLLYGKLLYSGGVLSVGEKNKVKEIFQSCCEVEGEAVSFYPRLYLLKARIYYYQLMNETGSFYKAVLEIVDYFIKNKQMAELERSEFEEGIYYLNLAAFQYNRNKVFLKSREILKGSSNKYYQLCAGLLFCLFEKCEEQGILIESFRYIQTVKEPSKLFWISVLAVKVCIESEKYERAIDFILIALKHKSDVRVDLQYQLRFFEIYIQEKKVNFRLAECLALSAHRYAKRHQLDSSLKACLIGKTMK